MKVLHVITSLQTGGAEKLMVDMLPRFRDNGLEVELCLFNGAKTPFYVQLEKSGVRIHDFGNGSVYNPLHIIRLANLVRKGHYDIVHTHNTSPQLFAALASVLCSVVLCTTEHNTSNRRRGWKWYAPIDRWMYSKYGHVICISEGTEKNLVESVKGISGKTSVIFNGVDLSKFECVGGDTCMKPSGDESISIIQVAGFRYQKDQDTVIKALQYLPWNYNLYLVGDGARREELESLVVGLNLQKRVYFLGVRTDVPSLLQKSDVVVVSSHWEGFGLAAVEGMAACKPVFASDIEGLREVVDGAGILFGHGNERDLAEKVESIMSNMPYYREVAEKCRQRAKDFDISKMVAGYMKTYQDLLQ